MTSSSPGWDVPGPAALRALLDWFDDHPLALVILWLVFVVLV